MATEEIFAKAKKAMDSHNWDESLSLFNEVLEKDPKNAKAYYHRAGIHKKNHRLDKAKSDYESMTSLEISDTDRWLAMAFIHELNESLLHKGGLTYSSSSVASSTKEYQQAVYYYSKIIQVAPNDEEARVDRSIMYCKLGQYAEAIEDTTVVIATNKDTRALSRSYASRAMAYLLLGNLSKAESDTQKSLSYSQKQPRANYLLGCIKEQQQKFDEAYEAFKNYLALKHFDIEMTADAKHRMSKLEAKRHAAEKEVAPVATSSDSEEIHYDLFLSHYQKTGGLLAMVLKLFLTQKDPNLRIFLDVDDLENIHDLKVNVQRTNCFALLLTEGVFERRFVQEEIRTALALNKKIVLVWDKERCSFPDASTIPSDISSVLLVRAVIWQAEKAFRKVVIDEIYNKIKANGVSKEIESVQDKVILAEPDTEKVVVKVSGNQSLEWLTNQIKNSLKIPESSTISLKYYDQDFAEYIPFSSLEDLPQKAKVKVFQK